MVYGDKNTQKCQFETSYLQRMSLREYKFSFAIFFLMFGIESRAHCTIIRCSAIDLNPSSDFIFYLVVVQSVL